jgi:hypothetical protein
LPTSIPWCFLWAEDHRIPEHDVVWIGRAIHALWWVLPQALEVPHQPLQAQSPKRKHVYTNHSDQGALPKSPLLRSVRQIKQQQQEHAVTLRAGVDIPANG